MPLEPASSDLIAATLIHPRVRDWISEDGASITGYFDPGAVTFHFAGAGFIQFKRETSRAWMVHIAVMRGGPQVRDFAMAALQAMRELGVEKFIATIGSWNKAALRLARACGFEQEGRLHNAVTKHGQPADLILMGAE